MLYLCYWELSERMNPEDRNEIAIELTQEGEFPPEGVELHRWVGTPDGWGIALMEADDFGPVNEALNMWRTAAGDEAFFEVTKTAPAAPAEDIIAQQAAMLEASAEED